MFHFYNSKETLCLPIGPVLESWNKSSLKHVARGLLSDNKARVVVAFLQPNSAKQLLDQMSLLQKQDETISKHKLIWLVSISNVI